MDSEREHIAEFIGLTPAPEPPAPKILDCEEGDGHSRTLLQYMAPDQDRIRAFLFEPRDRLPSGAVLALHALDRRRFDAIADWVVSQCERAG